MKCNAMVTDDTFLLKIPDLFTAKSHGDATSALSRKKKTATASDISLHIHTVAWFVCWEGSRLLFEELLSYDSERPTVCGNRIRKRRLTTPGNNTRKTRSGAQSVNLCFLNSYSLEHLDARESSLTKKRKMSIFKGPVVRHTLVSSFFHNISCSASLSSSAGSYV